MTVELIVRRSVLVAAILVATSSCRSGELSAPPAAPSLTSATSKGRDRQRPVRNDDGTSGGHVPQPVACKATHVAVQSGVFGPAGGTLLFGESRLIIPGGALRDTVTITATPLDDGTSTVQFQPEGLRFYKPAGLVLSAEDCALPDEGAPSIVYLGAAGDVLETIPARYDPHWKAVAAPIVHFSGYAIAF
jgi:hypothetical protein